MKPLLLLVDNNEEVLDSLVDGLRSKYRLLTATEGCEAMKILRKEPVQLVVSKMLLPGMDGLGLCRIIKTSSSFRHLPVVLYKAQSTLPSKKEILGLGADACMEQPFSIRFLGVQIANLLANRRSLKESVATSLQVPLTGAGPSRAEDAFVEKLNEAILTNLNDRALDVDKLARAMNMSRSVLYRQIKGIIDQSPKKLINYMRLKRAADLLAEGRHKIYEVADHVGYNSHTIFGRNFQRQFGITPSEFLKLNLKGR